MEAKEVKTQVVVAPVAPRITKLEDRVVVVVGARSLTPETQ